MEIVSTRHVGQHAVVRRGNERDAEPLERREDPGALLQLPPAFDRAVLVDAADDDCRTLWNAKTVGELRARGGMRFAGASSA